MEKEKINYKTITRDTKEIMDTLMEYEEVATEKEKALIEEYFDCLKVAANITVWRMEEVS